MYEDYESLNRIWKQIHADSVAMGAQKRGGYRQDAGNAYDDYFNIGGERNLHYDIFYYVVDGEDKPLTKVSSELEYVFSLWVSFTRSKAQLLLRMPDAAAKGEVCIRVIKHPAQAKTVGLTHTDACFATVPLEDSAHPVGLPFYSEMSKYWGYPPYSHRTRALVDSPRICVVGFHQLDGELQIWAEAKSYHEVLHELLCSG
jgi:hypothetical protein